MELAILMGIQYIAINCTEPLTPSGALISSCGLYRYYLFRHVALGTGKGICLFIMLNPSTADASINDPTITRCMGFAKSWGYGTLLVVNLFALRSTDPKALYGASDPVGPLNDLYISKAAKMAGMVVCAWGTQGTFANRGVEIMQKLLYEMKLDPFCFGITKNGHPKHPLYIDASQVPVSGLLGT